eukprot:scaffold147108_cov57-Cyclotella_meneghiniana.AAC.1
MFMMYYLGWIQSRSGHSWELSCWDDSCQEMAGGEMGHGYFCSMNGYLSIPGEILARTELCVTGVKSQ